MRHWLLLADPKSYSFDDLQRDRKTTWDGIAGSLAQKNLRAMAKGDVALIYHTAPDKAIIGTARVTSDPHPDPQDSQGRLVIVDIQPLQRLRRLVPLAELRQDVKLASMSFLKIQRIAVSPVTATEFNEILRMGR